MLSGELMKNRELSRTILYALTISLGMAHTMHCIEADKLHNYFWANYNQFRGNKEQASNWYQGMFDNNPPIHTYPGYIHHLDEIGNYQKIVEIYPKIESGVQDNPKIQLIYALALEHIGRSNAADEQLVKLQSKFKGDKEIAFYTANKYLRSKEPENALVVIDDYLKTTQRRPQNFIFYFMKSQIYTQLNKNEEALASIKQALQLHPQFDKGWLLLALIEEQAGKIQEAIQGYTSYLEVTTEPNKNIEQHLLQLALKQELAQKNKRMVVLDQPCFEKAAALFERKQYRQALGTLNECLKENPKNVELRLLKLRTLMAMEQQSEAIQTLAQWIGEQPNDEMWYKTLHLLVRSCGKAHEAIAALKKIEEQSSKALLPALYIADLALRSQDNHMAQLYLNRALERSEQTALKVKILFQLGLTYFRMDDPKRMGDALERAHALDPNFVPAINLLAYHYTDHSKDHERAQRLISIALQKYPSNVHLLDTQATIYTNQNKHEKAKEIREMLAANSSRCPGCTVIVKK
jgi:tetratricopeptide (TPR) repeat protein